MYVANMFSTEVALEIFHQHGMGNYLCRQIIADILVHQNALKQLVQNLESAVRFP